MDFLNILAQTTETTTTETVAAEYSLINIDWIWNHIISLNLLEAATFLAFGAVCLFYGWRVFKVLVVISFAMLGGFAGMMISDRIGSDDNLLLPILTSVTMAIVSIPMMRWCVSLLGAASGGILAAGIWYACELPEQFMWAGGLTGIVAGGMISFIVFKAAVMLFSSFGGSSLILAGALALLHLYPQTAERIQLFVFDEHWFLPGALLLMTLIGVYWQNKFIKDSPSWGI